MTRVITEVYTEKEVEITIESLRKLVHTYNDYYTGANLSAVEVLHNYMTMNDREWSTYLGELGIDSRTLSL